MGNPLMSDPVRFTNLRDYKFETPIPLKSCPEKFAQCLIETFEQFSTRLILEVYFSTRKRFEYIVDSSLTSTTILTRIYVKSFGFGDIYTYENSSGNVLLAGRQIEDLKAKAAHRRPCALFHG